MNNYEDWAQLVAKKLKGEADVIAAIEKDQLDDAAATEAFVRAVLTPFLPENFGVGEGCIVDAYGNRSDHFEVIIYNRDFPRIGLRGLQSDYLYESVLAAFTVRAKYIRKTFFESMNACASLATLNTNTDKSVLVRLAKKNGLKPGPNKSFIHEDPLHTARFELIGCPPAFMFGFSGIKHSYRQLQENIELWIAQRQSKGVATTMRAFPAVIATQGCFAWRNAAPLALSNREMLGIGNDSAPVRLIVLQMLYLLNRRLHATADGYGMKPSLNAYLSQFSAPRFEYGVGNVDELVSTKLREDTATAIARKDIEPARDRAPKVAAAATAAAAVSDQPVPAAVVPEAVTEPEAAELPKTIGEPEVSAGVFDRPSPFASAPAPADTDPQEEEKAEPARYKVPTAPLGSAPIPGMITPAEAVEIEPEPEPQPKATKKPPVAPLGSAPIPPSQPAAAPTPTADIIPPEPPVDIELTDFEVPEEQAAEPDYDSTVVIKTEESDYDSTLVIKTDASDYDSTLVIKPEESDYDSTLVIKPEESDNAKNQAQSSTDAFIARVKEQLSNQENLSENNEDPFTSTIPQ